MMTTEEKYSALLQEIGELLEGKNVTISCLEYRVKDLEEKLEAAEAEANAAVQHACEMAVTIERMTRDNERLERENTLLKGA
jgi:hypothetical protein